MEYKIIAFQILKSMEPCLKKKKRKKEKEKEKKRKCEAILLLVSERRRNKSVSFQEKVVQKDKFSLKRKLLSQSLR